MTMLSTSRIIMRRFESGDFAAFAALNADPDVMAYFPSVLSASESDQLAGRIQSKFDDKGWGLWAVELLESGEFIGFVGLNEPDAGLPFEPCTEVGWRVARQYWGRGYATEAAHRALRFAFEVLRLPEVVSFTAVRNERSRAVMRRLGMKNTGRNFAHPMVAARTGLQEHVLYSLCEADFR